MRFGIYLSRYIAKSHSQFIAFIAFIVFETAFKTALLLTTINCDYILQLLRQLRFYAIEQPLREIYIISLVS